MNSQQKRIVFLILFLSVLLLPLFWLEKGAVTIFFNQHRTAFFDVFFEYFTHLGSVIVYLPFLVYFLWKKKYMPVVGFIIVGLIHAIIVVLLKKIVFGATPRPVTYFKDKFELNFIEGITYNQYFSFPSGHTTTAFALILFLVLLSRQAYWVFIGVFIALLVGLSRIYLMQHFFEDTYFGMVIGSFCALVSYQIIKKRL